MRVLYPFTKENVHILKNVLDNKNLISLLISLTNTIYKPLSPISLSRRLELHKQDSDLSLSSERKTTNNVPLDESALDCLKRIKNDMEMLINQQEIIDSIKKRKNQTHLRKLSDKVVSVM